MVLGFAEDPRWFRVELRASLSFPRASDCSDKAGEARRAAADLETAADGAGEAFLAFPFEERPLEARAALERTAAFWSPLSLGGGAGVRRGDTAGALLAVAFGLVGERAVEERGDSGPVKLPAAAAFDLVARAGASSEDESSPLELEEDACCCSRRPRCMADMRASLSGKERCV